MYTPPEPTSADSVVSERLAVTLHSVQALAVRERHFSPLRTTRAFIRLWVDDKEVWTGTPNEEDTTSPRWEPCVPFTAAPSSRLKFKVQRVGHFVGKETLATIEGPLSQFVFCDDVQHPLESDDSPNSRLQVAMTFEMKPDPLAHDVACVEMGIEELEHPVKPLEVLGHAIRGMQVLGTCVQHVAKVHPIATVAVNILKVAYKALTAHTEVGTQITSLIKSMKDAVMETKECLGGLDPKREAILRDIVYSVLEGSALIKDWSHHYAPGRWRKSPVLIKEMEECRERLTNHKLRLHAAFMAQGHQENMVIIRKLDELDKKMVHVKTYQPRKRSSSSGSLTSDDDTVVEISVNELRYHDLSD